MNLPWTYVGRVNCVTGYGAAARHQLHVLRKAGLRFKIQDAGSAASPDPAGRDPFVKAARESDEGITATAGTIIHVSPNCAEEFRTKFPRPHVLVSVWETSKLPREWIELINRYDQVWCATQWQMRVYEHSGVDPSKLRHVTFAIDPELYDPDGVEHAYTRRLHNADDPHFVFGSVFQWTERKAPQALIGAYLRAFQNGEKVCLLIKSYDGDSPTSSAEPNLNRLRNSFRRPKVFSGEGRPYHPRIELVGEHMPRQKLVSLFRGFDAYVSTHRGEGWGLPLHEAALLGKAVIATDFSAPSEYLRGWHQGGALCPVEYALEPPHNMNWQPYYTLDQDWANPSVESCSEWMESLYERWKEGLSLTLSTENCGRRAPFTPERQRLAQLVTLAGEQAHAALSELV